MATSVFTFRGLPTLNSNRTLATINITFDPPSNLAGKLCYVECPAWNWDNKTEPTTAITAHDLFMFTTSWTQPISGYVTPSTEYPLGITMRNQAAFGFMFNNQCYSTGPILCQIPNGPHLVTINVYRTDGGEVGGDSTNIFTASLKFIEAASKSPPIGA